MFAESVVASRAEPALSSTPVTDYSASPLFFGAPGEMCFGFYHHATGPSRATGVVLCLPLGYEGTCAYETFTALAEKLTGEGFDVLRFDYHGTGDSPGADADPARVAAWRRSVRAACRELRRLSEVRSVALVGMRMGASFALLESAADAADVNTSAGDSLGVDSLVLWAPCQSGRAYTRELKMAAMAHLHGEQESYGDEIEALGFLYTEQTLADLSRVDLLKIESSAAKRILLIGKDGQSNEGPLGQHLRGLSELTFIAAESLSSIMRDSHERVVPEHVLREICGFLCAHHPRAPVAVPSEPVRVRESALDAGVRELPVHFGADGALFGILSEPAQRPAVQSNAESNTARTAIIMLNVGTNHRVGPNRLYVKMARHWARAGYTTLRFDLAGLGDSRVAAGYSKSRLYSKASTADVQAAIDDLSARGITRIVLVGLCSGAYVAFQSALTDKRVVAQVLLNPRRLSFSAGDTLESVMAGSYKSSRYYGRALFSVRTYWKLARGRMDVRGVAGRLGGLLSAHVRRQVDRLKGRQPPEEDVLSNVRLLCRRGVHSLFVVSPEDDGLDYLEFHLGSAGSNVRSPRFRMQSIAQSDHTFSRSDSQERLILTVSRYLEDCLR